MEQNDRNILFLLMKDNDDLKRLYRKHESLEKKLSKFENKTYLTVNEEIEAKTLKKQKLKGVDKMMYLVRQKRAA